MNFIEMLKVTTNPKGNSTWIKFQSDLKAGKVNEEKFAKYLESKEFKDVKFCDFKSYDIIAQRGGKFLTFEVKTDLIESENMAIEFFCLRRFEPSGIMATTADYWVQYFGDNAVMFKAEVLKKFLQETKPKMVYGGDDKLALLFLVKKSELPEHKVIKSPVKRV